MNWHVEPYAVAFSRPLATAHGVWRRRRGFLVTVTDAEGRVGRGEAVPLPDWGTETALECLAYLRGPGPLRPDGHLPREGGGRPAAWAAIEQARLDLEAQTAGVPLAALLGVSLRSAIPVNALVTGEIPPGYATYKLKLTGDLARDLPRVAAARAAIGNAALRLDANGSWTATEALHALEALAPFDPEYVEQPTSLEGLAEVVKHGAVPVAADECVRLDTLDRVLATGVRILIVKPAALGGLRATQALLARAPGLKVVLTSALDRGISTAGVLQLAATVMDLPACGLATAGLFDGGPLLPGLVPVAGAIAVPQGPGLWHPEPVRC
ncbi:MAG: o-succinylbenzoate synthase [Cyanobacteria bacterium RYN_339]|nr:o-succinylbenzoate synthase [Cyanobacteria bacterium RYN_339]